nr:MAG TPA: hypothetical protein [Caudoviricetes sp.]
MRWIILAIVRALANTHLRRSEKLTGATSIELKP